MRPYLLRVGICSCTSVYQGKLTGRIISLGRIPFCLTEIRIDDSNAELGMHLNRCHFFLDVHRVSVKGVQKYNTFLLRYERTSRGTLDIADNVDDYPEMTRKIPARVREVENWILDSLSTLTDYERRKWLSTMR